MSPKECFFKQDTPCGQALNIIKTRDDARPVCFVSKGDGKFALCKEHKECQWCDDNEGFDEKTLRERIEPWLTALFQSEHLSLLVGVGLTKGICKIAEAETKAEIAGMQGVSFSNYHDEIEGEAKRTARKLGRDDGNFEDYIRVANELCAGLKIMGNKDKAALQNAVALQKEIEEKIKDFTESLLKTERELAESPPKGRNKAFNCLVSFLMSFASRPGTRDRVNIFTTNYDRLIEEAADLAGLHLLDRFIGKLSPIFRASRLNLDLHYNPPGIRGEPRYLEGVARFTKLHGSLDWVQVNSLIRKIALPFGASEITPYIQAPRLEGASAFNLMIYPNSAKDRETAAYPYVELFRDFSAAICRPNSTIVTYGYSFGDEHINRVIQDMLTIPSTHLVIISYDDYLGRIRNFYTMSARSNQITLLIGPDVAQIDTLTEKFLPKSAIDFATSRMEEILQSRWASQPPKDTKEPDSITAAPLSKEDK